jgi:hypothetical protein
LGTEAENPDNLEFNSPNLPMPEQGQAEASSQRDGTIPPVPPTTHSGDIQPTESAKPAEQKPELPQNGDSAE